MKYRGHETFSIRKNWLAKGIEAVQKNPGIFTDKTFAPMEELGIGRNMVVSLRYWMKAVGLTKEEKGKESKKTETSFTPLGKIIYEHDKFVEEAGTLWLLQNELAANRENATSWYFFFNEFNLDDKIFGLPVNEDVIYYAITNELANKRVGTACTKTRAEVHGSNAKPYKQKGTGNARRGDKKSPITVGGGTIFGPKPRDYSYAIPKKEKRLAMKSILSLQAQADRLTVVEDFTIESGKTKDLVKILKNFVKDERTVILLKDDDAKIKQAGRNLPNVYFLSYNRLRAHDLFYGRKIIMLEGAAKNLSDFYAEDKEAK